MTTLQALDLLQRDEGTELIALISKPIDPELAPVIISAAQASAKPTILNLIGYPPPGRRIGNLYFAATLQEAAELAVELVSSAKGDTSNGRQVLPPSEARYLRGLFSGGTLAYEALLGLQTFLMPLYSNIPLRPNQKLADSLVSQAHTILDLGEDEYTQGRLHPMMDNDLRIRRLRQEAADEAVRVILLDIVLGEGAHPDPASEIAPVIAEIKGQRDMAVVALVLGTDEDPQGLQGQIAALSAAGAYIVRDVSEAVAVISGWLGVPYQYAHAQIAVDSFVGDLSAINVGLESFYDSLKDQGASAVQVEWRPPAGGKEDLMAILAKMKNL